MSDSYPALIELISRLEGKDKKTCEAALYCLNAADRRDSRLRAKTETVAADNENLRAEIDKLKRFHIDVAFQLRKTRDERRILRSALKPFVVDDWVEYATFTGGYLRDAAAAYKETSDANT